MDISISDLLKRLPDITSDTELVEWCNELCEFYKQNERHSYSEISRYIFTNDGGIEYTYRIVPKLIEIQENIPDQEVCKKIGKLIDHIQLEQIRYETLSGMIRDSVEERYLAMNNEGINEYRTLFEEARKLQEQQSSEIKAEIEEAQNLAADAEQKVQNAQGENVAILGIFSSVVLAFTGLMMFSASVLENIDTISAYRIILVCIIIGFVFFNVIAALLIYIQRIVHGKYILSKEKVRRGKTKTFIQENIFWIIINLIFVLMIIGTVFMWENSMEKKLQDQSGKNYLNDLKRVEMEALSGNSIE